MTDDLRRAFADITARLEDLHGVAVEGQRRDNGPDMQRVLLLQLRNGTAAINGTLTSMATALDRTTL